MKNECEIVNGIPCYAKDMANKGDDYPVEHFEKLFSLENRHFWFRSRNRIIKNIVKKYLGSGPTNKYLEIGCGTGNVLQAISSNSNYKLMGAELFIKGLVYAKSRMPDVEFVQLDARKLPFVKEFNGIGAFDVLEHIQEDELVIKNVYEALLPGGYFFITVPQHKWLWSIQDDMAYHKRRYERVELTQKLVGAGFDVKVITSFVSTLLPIMYLSRRNIDAHSIDEKERNDYEFKELEIPSWMSTILTIPMKIDELLINLGVSLPFGGSLLVVAQKKKGNING